LELFHGPTLAFKDVALQFLGNLFSYILSRSGSKLNILAATSGDTGSAAIAGVRGREGINIFVMHPHNRVSAIQKLQMTTVLDANVHNIAVEGTFDDAQNIMKSIASDLDFKRKFSLGAVNSVNWARVLAQIVYYVYAALQVKNSTGSEAVRFCVPTGNFGNILAGWYAIQMGAPIGQLILATNRNDILSRFFNTGVYSLGAVSQTISPSMDIQVASNFERYLYYKFDSDPAVLREKMKSFAHSGSLTTPVESETVTDSLFAAGSAGEKATRATIGKYYREYDYVLDPHSAVGVTVAEALSLGDSPVICLATAHPAKFPEAVREATGKPGVGSHPAIAALEGLESRCVVLPAEEEAVRKFIAETL
ncbi:MAG: threonine synthase, partial [Planctomycetes bacterium]|nr:threonine synthase [Planctomycetota bacterium]